MIEWSSTYYWLFNGPFNFNQNARSCFAINKICYKQTFLWLSIISFFLFSSCFMKIIISVMGSWFLLNHTQKQEQYLSYCNWENDHEGIIDHLMILWFFFLSKNKIPFFNQQKNPHTIFLAFHYYFFFVSQFTFQKLWF